MIDVVHTKQGKSFRGLVAYLLEGSKGQENPERVGWTETRNLATHKPMTAAKVMAATALDQARLKSSAGISSAGRKSNNHVLHYTLSWTQDQQVSREEMMRAVNGSLAALGEKAGKKGGRRDKKGRLAVRDQFASEHQALVVAHKDTKEPHVHVVVNRVHPGHGVMLPTSNDFKLLSRWAERYERETGGLIVDQRAINNAARDRGETVLSQKRIPRDVYELEFGTNDNRPATVRVKAEQRAKDAELARASALQRAERKQAWLDAEATHKARKNGLRKDTAKQVRTARRAARDTFSEDWAILHHEHKAATAAFDRSEEHLAGQAMNALKALLSLKAPVNVLWSSGARKSVLENAQKDQVRELAARQRQAEERAERDIRTRLRNESTRLGHLFIRERAELILKHRATAAKLRAQWKKRESDRKLAWHQHKRAMAALPPEKRFGVQTIEGDAAMKEIARQHMNRMREAHRERLRRELREAMARDQDEDRGR